MLTNFSRHFTKRTIAIVLGCLWTIDGLLQLQPKMFTKQFANQIIAPVGQGQPAVVHDPIHLVVHLILLQPALFDILVIIIQLGLGALILWRRTRTIGLIASIFWGLGVWYLGEGLGGLASGQTSLLMGAPGAALLYAIIAYGVLPQKEHSDKQPASWLAYVWVVLWLGGAVLQLNNGQNTARSIAAMIASMAQGAPGWLANLDMHASHFVTSIGGLIVVLLVLVQALVGVGVLLSKYMKATAVFIGILVSLLFWVIGQSLGGYYTGLATDPSTAPLFILLGLAILNIKDIKLDIT